MLRLKNLEIGKLSTFLDLTHQNQETFPIELHKFRNGILGEMWIKSIHDWNIKDKVIDVGCGYATLPGYLAERVSEVWGADDFGINSDDKYWERGKSPKEISKKYPKVKYVFERLGKNASNFPSNYFDVVLSNQALHVAPFPHKAIWEDMFRVMNKQYKSCIIVSMICNFCSDGEPRNALKRLKEIDELESNLIEKWENMVDISMREFDDIQNKYNNSLHRLSPALYTIYVSTILGVERFPVPEELRAKNFCTDVNSLIEPASNGFGNAQFSGEQNEANQYKYGRYAPLLIKFEWQGIKDPVYIGNESKKDLIKYMLNADIGGTSEALNHDKYADIYSFKEDESYSTHTTSFLVETKNREGFDLELLVKGNGRNNFGLWIRSDQNQQNPLEIFADTQKACILEENLGKDFTKNKINMRKLDNEWVELTLSVNMERQHEKVLVNILVRNSMHGSSCYQGDSESGIMYRLNIF